MTLNEESEYLAFTPAPTLASSRYNRQVLIPQISISGQERIGNAKVLIVGLGGLGAPASLYLAGAGVGVLGLLDDDVVETSNLHRQIVHREDSVQQGLTKVASAIRGCRELNHEIELIAHELRLDGSKGREVLDIVSRYDIVLDCTDNPATRYLISDVCVLLNKTLVSGAAQKLEGQLMVLNYATADSAERGPCYRCVFPVPPAPEMVRGCSEIGILGPVVGTIGTMMANEALRLIVRQTEESRKPNMLLYNAWPREPRSMWRTIGLRGRRKDCIACGDQDILQEKGSSRINIQRLEDGSLDYIAFCGRPADIMLLHKEQRMVASDFLLRMGRQTAASAQSRVCVVDVREKHEVEMGPKINGSVHAPLPDIISNKNVSELESRLGDKECEEMVFVCQQGNDSQIAAKHILARHEYESNPRLKFIGDVEGGFTEIQKVVEAMRSRASGQTSTPDTA